MAFVQFTRVSLAFGDRDILTDVNLNLASGSKAALAGANGAGKTTLMKVIAGIIAPDTGERAIERGTRISYLPQSGIVHQGRSLRDEAEEAYQGVRLLLARLESLGGELEKSSPGQGSTRALVEEHHRVQEEIENSGYYRREADISQVLRGLGFSLADLDRPCEEFSGGWQMRIALAKILLEDPDIMLLDEPTNYLDIEARAWLLRWLQSFKGGCLLVSHDRYFLDATVNEVFEVFGGNLKRYAGNYTTYEALRAQENELLLKRYQAQQEEIARTEALIRRFRYKASKAAFAQDLIKRLERMERIVIPENLKRVNISFPPPPHSGRTVLSLEGISRSYGARRVINKLDLQLDRGERLLVAGVNGAGKTTLLRIIASVDQDYQGSLSYGAGVQVGYFSQDAAEKLGGPKTVEAYLEDEAPTHLVPQIRSMLGAFLFRGDDVYKPLSVLSGGEKSRLALLSMLLRPINLLVLDEPTNHLDLSSKDILLDCLKSYKGTIIFVSHDRGFMEALSSKTLELRAQEEGGSHRLFYGNYKYYLDRLEREALGLDDQSLGPGAKTPEPALPPTLSSSEQRSGLKQHQAQVRRLQRQEAEILKQLEDLEGQKARLEADLAKPEVYSSGERARVCKQDLDRCSAALEEKGREWEAIARDLEGLAESL
ncbi:MAG: ABC-F family ATP-binding cassette domain-containing protein [Treponema sp.]|nr:ABC-F family ATP-binding cassette domain-containing protein [Treponema sp.]